MTARRLFVAVLSVASAAFAVLTADAAVIEVGPCSGNATPAAVAAAARLRDGDMLRFADGGFAV